MSWADANTSMKTNAGAQLRTFSKAVTCTASVYRQSNVNDSGTYSGSGSVTWTANTSNAPDTVFDGDLPSTIGSGQLIRADDIASAMANAVRSAVDKIEGLISNFSIDARVCHNSCHTSCHSSRGRR